ASHHNTWPAASTARRDFAPSPNSNQCADGTCWSGGESERGRDTGSRPRSRSHRRSAEASRYISLEGARRTPRRHGAAHIERRLKPRATSRGCDWVSRPGEYEPPVTEHRITTRAGGFHSEARLRAEPEQ